MWNEFLASFTFASFLALSFSISPCFLHDFYSFVLPQELMIYFLALQCSSLAENPFVQEFKLNPNAREFFPPVFPPSPAGQMQVPQYPHHLVPPGMHPGHQGFVPGGPMPMFVPPPPGHPPQYQPMMFVGPPAGPPGAYGVPQISGPLGQPGMKVPMQGHPQMV